MSRSHPASWFERLPFYFVLCFSVQCVAFSLLNVVYILLTFLFVQFYAFIFILFCFFFLFYLLHMYMDDSRRDCLVKRNTYLVLLYLFYFCILFFYFIFLFFISTRGGLSMRGSETSLV